MCTQGSVFNRFMFIALSRVFLSEMSGFSPRAHGNERMATLHFGITALMPRCQWVYPPTLLQIQCK